MAAHGTATVQSYTSATDLLRDAAEIFAKREVEHSFMLGVLGNLQKDMDFYHVTPQLLAVKGSGPTPLLLATMVYPYPLVLSLAVPSASDEEVAGALQCLADYVATVLKEKKVFPMKLMGLPALVDPFTERLAQICGDLGLRPTMAFNTIVWTRQPWCHHACVWKMIPLWPCDRTKKEMPSGWGRGYGSSIWLRLKL